LTEIWLRKRAIPASGALDKGGDPIDPPAPDDHDAQGFIDRYSEFTQAQAGIPRDDLKLCLFGKSLPDGVAPEKDDICQVTGPAGSIFAGRWFQIRERAIDPAGALWECQSFEIKAPA
jgi:hypothetical protein